MMNNIIIVIAYTYAKHSYKQFTRNDLFNPHNNSIKLLAPLQRWGNWETATRASNCDMGNQFWNPERTDPVCVLNHYNGMRLGLFHIRVGGGGRK